MRKEDISDSLNMLDDEFIVETDKVRKQALDLLECNNETVDAHSKKITATMTRRTCVKWGALAACVCIAILLGVFFVHTNPSNPDNNDHFYADSNENNHAQDQEDEEQNIPQQEEDTDGEKNSTVTELAYAPDGLQILELTYLYEGGSFEGLMYPNVDELYAHNLANNPWNEQMELTTLPVYKDLAHASNGVDIALDADTMYALVENVASALGAEILETEEETFCLEGERLLTTIHADADIAQFSVYADGDVTIRYTKYGKIDTCMKLPDTIDSSNKEAVVEYWAEITADITNISEYKIVIESDYTFERNLLSRYGFYDVNGDDVQEILNYTYKNVGFVLDNNGNLEGLSMENDLAYAEKIGDYPIVSVKEAKELLIEGKYLTSVPYEITNEEYVVSAELVYREAQYGEYLIPYYRFYVEIPDEEQVGLNCYGAYYVPAIKQEYISHAQIYDGSFN